VSLGGGGGDYLDVKKCEIHKKHTKKQAVTLTHRHNNRIKYLFLEKKHLQQDIILRCSVRVHEFSFVVA
jgi:hypothetical protein